VPARFRIEDPALAQQLRQVEQRIMELVGQDADGQPLTRPFAHAATVSKKTES